MERVRAEQIVMTPTTAKDMKELKEAIQICIDGNNLYSLKAKAIITAKTIIDAFTKISSETDNYKLSSLFLSLFIDKINTDHDKNLLKVIEQLSNFLYTNKKEEDLINMLILTEEILNN